MENNLISATECAEQKILRLRVETVRGNLQGVKDALNQGVSVDQPFRAGEWNALMHASSMGHQHIVEYLLKEGADPNFHKELFTPLMAACASNNDSEEKLLSCVNHLLRFSANVNAVERHRLTPLMFTCKQGHLRIARELLANNVDLNAQDSQGWTALFWAVSKGYIDIVELLIEGGARTEVRDRSGGTALLLATRKGHHEIEKILRLGPRRNCLELKADRLSYSIEDDNSNLTNSLDRNGDIQTVISNQLLNKEFSKHLSIDDDESLNIGLKHLWPKGNTLVLEIIEQLRCKPCKKSEEESLTYAMTMKILADLVTQISNIHTAMAILRYQLQNVPLDLPQDNCWAASARLRCLTRFAYCNAEKLFLESKYLQEYAIEMNVSNEMPSEVMKEATEEPPETNEKSSVLTTIIVASACFIVIMWNAKVIRSFTLFNF